MALHECKDSPELLMVLQECDARGTPRVCVQSIRTDTTLSIHHVSRADQNCAGLKRAERHETRRDVVSGQTEGNSVRVVEDVRRVEGFSHKIVQVHQQVKTP